MVERKRRAAHRSAPKSTPAQERVRTEEEGGREIEKSLDKTDKMKYGRERRRLRSGDELELKLGLPAKYRDPSMKYRWFKGTPQRLMRAQELDWAFTDIPELAKGDGSDDTRVKRLVGTLEKGEARYDYLMEMPKEWYDEYQAEKLKALEEKDDAIRRGEFENRIEKSARHTPQQKIVLERR